MRALHSSPHQPRGRIHYPIIPTLLSHLAVNISRLWSVYTVHGRKERRDVMKYRFAYSVFTAKDELCTFLQYLYIHTVTYRCFIDSCEYTSGLDDVLCTRSCPIYRAWISFIKHANLTPCNNSHYDHAEYLRTRLNPDRNSKFLQVYFRKIERGVLTWFTCDSINLRICDNCQKE